MISPMIFPGDVGELRAGPVRLSLVNMFPADPESEMVPYFRFAIRDAAQRTVGHINFRVGNTRRVLLYAGHIGYEILPDFRGASLAYHACKALAPLIKQFYPSVILTVAPSNAPSIGTVQKLGAVFLDEIDAPLDDPAYESGPRKKKRYRWTL